MGEKAEEDYEVVRQIVSISSINFTRKSLAGYTELTIRLLHNILIAFFLILNPYSQRLLIDNLEAILFVLNLYSQLLLLDICRPLSEVVTFVSLNCLQTRIYNVSIDDILDVKYSHDDPFTQVSFRLCLGSLY